MYQAVFLGVWTRQGTGVGLGWPEAAPLMVELRVIRKREIQKENQTECQAHYHVGRARLGQNPSADQAAE